MSLWEYCWECIISHFGVIDRFLLITISNIYHKVNQSRSTTFLTHPTEWERHHVLLLPVLRERYLSQQIFIISVHSEERDNETKTVTSGLVHKVNFRETATFFGPGFFFFLIFLLPTLHLPCNFYCQVFKSKMQATGAEAYCLFF